MTRDIIFFLLFLLCCNGIMPTSSFACSCGPKAELMEARETSSLVFMGQVVKVVLSVLKPGQNEVHFKIEKIFKLEDDGRPKKDTVVIYTSIEEALCGFHFITGRDYLVFATGTPAQYKTDLCTRTKLLEDVLLDVDQFELKGFTVWP